MVKWLHGNRFPGPNTGVMNAASAFNRLDLVKGLHENRTEGCSTLAMDRTRSLEMVEWLHENRNEGCTASAMDNALAHGDFELTLWLNTHRSESCTSAGVEKVIRNELFQWLCKTYPDKVDLESLKRSSLCSGVHMTVE